MRSLPALQCDEASFVTPTPKDVDVRILECPDNFENWPWSLYWDNSMSSSNSIDGESLSSSLDTL